MAAPERPANPSLKEKQGGVLALRMAVRRRALRWLRSGSPAAWFGSRRTRLPFYMQHRAPDFPGELYVVYGGLAPSYNDAGFWERQMPRPSSAAGLCRVMGLSMPVNDFKVLEMFSGAMGGWHSAAKHVPGWDVEVAVDSDLEDRELHDESHGYGGAGASLHGPWCSGRPFGGLQSCPEPGVAACPQFPQDRRGYGYCPVSELVYLGHSGGSVLAERQDPSSNGCDTEAPPAVLVLFEQVAGFRQHHEFEAFVQAMNEAGFRIAVIGVHDFALLTHCTRRRWLCVFVNSAHVTKWDLLEKWMHPIICGEVTFNPKDHCIRVFTPEQQNNLEISREDYEVLNDPAMLSKWNRHSPGAKHHPFSARVCSEGDVLPTITASYRTAITFGKDYLSHNGLMSWVIRDAQCMTRWFSKHEACRALGFGPYTSLPKDEQTAFEGIGNSISPLHAALVIIYASDVAALQTGGQASFRFAQFADTIRSVYKPMDAYVVQEAGDSHQMLVTRLPRPGITRICPHCQEAI